MSDDRQHHAPHHPTLDRRSLVLWCGYRSALSLAALDRNVVGSVAMALKNARAEAALCAEVRAGGFGLVLPGEAWRNQLHPSHHGRSAAFNALPFASNRPLDPDVQLWSESFLSEYADAFLDAQLGAGATLALTPGHHPVAELGHARTQDVELAQAAVEAWRERQGWRSSPQDPSASARQLFATIVVSGKHLPEAAEALVQLYAPLAVDGYWIVIMDCGQTGRQLAGVADLALGLQEQSERPAVVSGVAGIHAALLASGVAATCAGYHGMSPKFPPAPPPNRGDEQGIGVQVFHPAILGVIPLGQRYDDARAFLFANFPCHCGAHPPHECPRGRVATLTHNTACLQAEAAEAIAFPPVISEARLESRARKADELRSRVGLRSLRAGWGGVAPIARARRAEPGVAGEM